MNFLCLFVTSFSRILLTFLTTLFIHLFLTLLLCNFLHTLLLVLSFCPLFCSRFPFFVSFVFLGFRCSYVMNCFDLLVTRVLNSFSSWSCWSLFPECSSTQRKHVTRTRTRIWNRTGQLLIRHFREKLTFAKWKTSGMEDLGIFHFLNNISA